MKAGEQIVGTPEMQDYLKKIVSCSLASLEDACRLVVALVACSL